MKKKTKEKKKLKEVDFKCLKEKMNNFSHPLQAALPTYIPHFIPAFRLLVKLQTMKTTAPAFFPSYFKLLIFEEKSL